MDDAAVVDCDTRQLTRPVELDAAEQVNVRAVMESHVQELVAMWRANGVPEERMRFLLATVRRHEYAHERIVAAANPCAAMMDEMVRELRFQGVSEEEIASGR